MALTVANPALRLAGAQRAALRGTAVQVRAMRHRISGADSNGWHRCRRSRRRSALLSRLLPTAVPAAIASVHHRQSKQHKMIRLCCRNWQQGGSSEYTCIFLSLPLFLC